MLIKISYIILLHTGSSSCCSTLTLDSNGLTRTHHSNILGDYEQDGFSNGRISYKLEGKKMYLFYNSELKWMVSKIVFFRFMC